MEENGNVNVEGLVDYMATLVPGLSLSGDGETTDQPPLPPKQKDLQPEDAATAEVNGQHSDEEQAPGQLDSTQEPEQSTSETPPVVPPRRRDHRKQASQVREQHKMSRWYKNE